MRASHEHYPPIKLCAQEHFLVRSLRTSQDTRPTYKSMNALRPVLASHTQNCAVTTPEM
ncbi:hypothetical protein M405DRAFT_824116, partial [Rhizopogon salebrosus TDB-379]